MKGKGKKIKEILAEYLKLRDEGFITDEDYEYKKKKLLKKFLIRKPETMK